MRRRTSGVQPPWQLGMLAQLQRVGPAHAGRLVVVECPATPVLLPGTDRRLPAWRVCVMGRNVNVGGRECSDLVVAEDCLLPLCRLSKRSARALVMAQAHRDFDTALCSVADWLQANPLDEDALDAEMRRAARQAVAQWTLPPVLLPTDC